MYINQDTTGLEDIWHGVWPKDTPYNESFRPMVFQTEKEAKRYKTEIMRQQKKEWDDGKAELQILGYKKPSWDVYPYSLIEAQQEVQTANQ